jgi:hypothetical protein
MGSIVLVCVLNKVKVLIQTLTGRFGIIEKLQTFLIPKECIILGNVSNVAQGLTKIYFALSNTIGCQQKRKNAAAENSFGICLERGIGVHKNLSLAGQYYLRSAQQGHPDGANNFGF